MREGRLISLGLVTGGSRRTLLTSTISKWRYPVHESCKDASPDQTPRVQLWEQSGWDKAIGGQHSLVSRTDEGAPYSGTLAVSMPESSNDASPWSGRRTGSSRRRVALVCLRSPSRTGVRSEASGLKSVSSSGRVSLHRSPPSRIQKPLITVLNSLQFLTLRLSLCHNKGEKY